MAFMVVVVWYPQKRMIAMEEGLLCGVMRMRIDRVRVDALCGFWLLALPFRSLRPMLILERSVKRRAHFRATWYGTWFSPLVISVTQR
jgi:hypothetical protein